MISAFISPLNPVHLQNKENSAFVLTVLTSVLLSFFLCYRLFLPKEQGWKTIITSDGRGYYAYLPAIFIYGDLTFQQVTKIEKKVYGRYDYLPEYLVTVNKKTVNKYFSGEAFLLMPFFLMALFFSWIMGLPLDGYSFLFQFFIGLGALFYLISGLLFLQRILQRMYFSDKVISWIIPVMLLGTNIFYYSIWQASMSHVYSFFAINGFIFFTLKAMKHRDKLNPIFTGLFLGVVILIRPVNGLVILLIPFLSSGWPEFVSFLRYSFAGRGFLAIPALCVLIVIQPILWYLQTGEFMIWSYPNEGFYFRNPEIMNVLFSYRKGLFIYTPVLLLSLFGVILLFGKKFFRFIFMFFFLVLFTYITASWWNWYYGDSLGMRPFIDFYGVFAILIAMFLNSLPQKRIFSFVKGVMIVLVLLNLFQTWQYLQGIIHPFDMDKEKYRYVFLQADSTHINCLGGNKETPFYGVDLNKPYRVFEHDLEKRQTGWNDRYRKLDSIHSFSGRYLSPLDSTHEYSSGLEMRADTFAPGDGKLFCKVSLMLNDSSAGASNLAYLVINIDSIDKGFNFWNGLRLNGIPHQIAGQWRKCTYQWNLPIIKNPRAVIKIYVWNPMRKTFAIDDMRIELYRAKSFVASRQN